MKYESKEGVMLLFDCTLEDVYYLLTFVCVYVPPNSRSPYGQELCNSILFWLFQSD